MDKVEIKNAVIESYRFDIERGLSLWVTLDYGGSGQGFGGWLLYAPKGWAAHENGGNFCGHFIYRLLEVCGVEDLKQIVGKAIRAKTSHNKVYAVGHILKDDWFDPEKEFKPWINSTS